MTDSIMPGIPLVNIRRTQVVCTCDIHNNELLQQIDATLPNGRAVKILLDRYGYHVAIDGDTSQAGGMSKGAAARLLREAMQ